MVCSWLLCPSAVLSALACWWSSLEINERKNYFSVRKAKAYIQFTEVNQKSWCPQSQTGLLCRVVALGSVHAHLAFLGMTLPTELVLFKEFSVLFAGSCVRGSKKNAPCGLSCHLKWPIECRPPAVIGLKASFTQDLRLPVKLQLFFK